MGRRKEKPGMMLYFELIPALEQLTDEQRGKLLYGAICYAKTGEAPNLEKDLVLNALWPLVAARADSDDLAYQSKKKEASYRRRYGIYKAQREKEGMDCLTYPEWRERVEEPDEE